MDVAVKSASLSSLAHLRSFVQNTYNELDEYIRFVAEML
jgi:hypothetical protein